MPEDLKAEYNAIDVELENVPKNANGFPDFTQIPDALKARMEKLRTDYEAKTGHPWPMPPMPQ